MERLLCIALGACIAVAIIGAALVVRDALEDRREALDARIKNLARGVCLEVTRDIRWYNINGFEERVEEMIDSKLAEKEGEHEATEL